MSTRAAAFDVLVVGAGIVGCACARECALAGLRVGVVEGGSPAGGATGAAMGHIVVLDDSPAQLALTQLSRRVWSELAPHLPRSAEYQTPGTLWIASDEDEMREVYAKHSLYEQKGIPSSVLDARHLASLEPQLRHGLAGALLVPDDAVLSPSTAATYLLHSVQGVTFVRGQSVTAIAANTLSLADGSALHAQWIVLATGADCSLMPALPIQKRKGHLLLTDRYPGFVHHQIVELGYLKSAHKPAGDSVAFNLQPRQSGHLLIGSSRQYGTDDPAVEAPMLRRIMERAASFMPGLAGLSILRTWTGIRAATPDKLPLIGSAETFGYDPSIRLAMGFEGLGITSAPAAAQLLVDGMLDRPSAVDRLAYDPGRSFAPSPNLMLDAAAPTHA